LAQGKEGFEVVVPGSVQMAAQPVAWNS
jgi:hypothetical protein